MCSEQIFTSVKQWEMEKEPEDNETIYETWSNGTTFLATAPTFGSHAFVKTVVLSVITVLSICGNLATLVSIRLQRINSKSTIYAFIFQLAIADVFVSVFCGAGEAIWTFTVQWLADDITCKVVKYLQMFSLYLSTYVLVLIGVDHYMAIRYPMKSKDAHRWCNVKIVTVWLLSFIFSIPQIFIFRVLKGPFVEDFYQCVTYGVYDSQWQEQFYTTLTFILMFIIPIAIITTTYLAMFRSISNSVSTFQDLESRVTNCKVKASERRVPTSAINRINRLRMAKNKSLKLTVTIVLTFLICWTPYYVMMMVYIFFEPYTAVGEQMQFWVFFFGISNSMLNPLIYGVFHLRRRRRKHQSTRHYSSNTSRYRASLKQTTVTSTVGCLETKATSVGQRSRFVKNEEEETPQDHDEIIDVSVHLSGNPKDETTQTTL